MVELTNEALRDLAIAALHDLTGAPLVADIEVEPGRDAQDEGCFFSIRIGEGQKTALSPGLLRIRLINRLHERLVAAGDARYPFLNNFGFYPLPKNA